MFTQEEYFWAWFYYLVGVAIFMLAFWFLSEKIKIKSLRYSTRIIAAVFFLVPWYTDTEKDLFSPAWLVSFIEGFFQGPEAFWRAGTPLVIVLSITIVLCIGVFGALWMRDKKAASA